MEDLIGLIGGMAGLVAFLLQAYEIYRNRMPDLELFLPFNGTSDAPAGALAGHKRVLIALVRISNTSNRPAYLYLETIKAEIYSNDAWHKVLITYFPKGSNLLFDMPEHQQQHIGLKDIPFWSKFDDPVIPIDKPYSRYMVFSCSDSDALENAEKLKLIFKDSHLREYRLFGSFLYNKPEGEGL